MMMMMMMMINYIYNALIVPTTFVSIKPNIFFTQVRSTLEKVLGNVGTFHFCVHPVGVVMEL